MPQIRKVEGFGGRYMLVNLAYVIPEGFCFWVLWRSSSADTFGVAFVLGLVGFIACVATGIYLDVRRLRRFRCPVCHTQLPWHQRKPGERLQYLCERCDTIWDTGLTEADD